MNILIIEDETAAAVNLKAILKSIDPTFNIITVLESIEEAVEYFEDKTQPTPDLVFMVCCSSSRRYSWRMSAYAARICKRNTIC